LPPQKDGIRDLIITEIGLSCYYVLQYHRAHMSICLLRIFNLW